jgi:hypothetical protein
MFFNKYCEDINLPTVSNKFADIVVDYETSRSILIDEEEDFDIDERVEDEELFQAQVDEELDNKK